MTENKGLISTSQSEEFLDSATPDAVEQQIIALHTLLNLPVAERNALLAKQAATIAEYFVPGSDEMEWVEEYVENDR